MKRVNTMGNIAPETAYQGSKGMKRVEGSRADKKADKRYREDSKADKKADMMEARRTLAGKHRKSRCACK